MGIISRPIKTGGSQDVVAGNDVLASEWNGDLNPIYDEFNGNIDDANIKGAAAIQGTKIAASPSGIPKSRINVGTITKEQTAIVKVATAILNFTGAATYRFLAPAFWIDTTGAAVRVEVMAFRDSGTAVVVLDGDNTPRQVDFPGILLANNTILGVYLQDVTGIGSPGASMGLVVCVVYIPNT